jgi:hypothetical protein
VGRRISRDSVKKKSVFPARNQPWFSEHLTRRLVTEPTEIHILSLTISACVRGLFVHEFAKWRRLKIK